MNSQLEVNLLPENDVHRVTALARYKIVQTPCEHAFDHITKLATKIFDVPIALISFVDEEEVFIKAITGLPGVTTLPREKSLCTVAIRSSEPTIIESVFSVPWTNRILSAYNLGIEFYASVPLITPDGFAIGTLCLMDRKTRAFDEGRVDLLKDLAGVVMHEMEARRACIEQTERQLATNARFVESERRFRDMIQQCPIAIAILRGRELIIESANNLALSLWGKTSAVMNKTMATALPELEGQPFFNLLDNVFASGNPFYGNELKTTLVHNGKLKDTWFNFVYHPIKDEKGETERIMIIATDVTETVEARSEKERAEDMLHFSIEAACIGTWYIDGKTRAFTPSSKLKKFFGYNAEDELSYEAALAIIAEDHRDRIHAATEATITDGKPFNVEFPIVRGGGQNVRWLKGVGRMYYDTVLKTSNFSGVVMDITEQKEREIRQNDFIGMISQELKTSLSLLKTDMQLMYVNAKRQSDFVLLDAIGSMQHQVKKMSMMINGFMHTSQLEGGRIQLHPQEFNLFKLLNEVVEETTMMYSSHTINISSREQIIAVHADREKIAQVVSNFLINAIKYSKNGESISLDADFVDDQVIIAVKIIGKGLNQQGVVRLFDYFHQNCVVSTEQISDFGMELHQCAEIIKHHNGRVWVESSPDKGSASFFSLPLL